MPELFTSLKFPIGGVVKRLGFSQQTPHTTPSALNVRPDDVLAGRERGGSRPGLKKAYAQQLGSGAVVRLVTDLTYQSGGVAVTQLYASSAGKLYRDVAGTLTEIANYTGAVALASTRRLSAADLFQKLYIAGSNDATTKLLAYTPGTDTLAEHTAAEGTTPTGCLGVVSWRGRLVLFGDGTNNAFFSRQEAPDDFDYAQTDEQAALALGTGTTGRPGEAIITAIPHTDECLIIGCPTSLWILRGDPGSAGGRLTELSPNIGILGRHAWCYDTEGWLYFLSHDGLYAMPPGCGVTPRSTSRERLPDELLSIDRSTHQFELAYDSLDRGVHVHVTSNTAGAGTSKHYWLDVKHTGSGDQGGNAAAAFWPITLQDDHEPFSTWTRRDYVPSTSGVSDVVYGCRDGYLRTYDHALAQDDSANFDWHIDYGPFPLGQPGLEGMIAEVQFVSDESSGSVDCDIRVGQSAKAAYSSATPVSFVFSRAGLNYNIHPRVRGGYGVLRLSNSQSNQRSSWEELLVKRVSLGRRRV